MSAVGVRLSRIGSVLLLIGCLLQTVGASAQRFHGPAYSAVAPDGWTTTTQNVVKGGVAFLGPTQQGFAVNINILSEPAPHETLAQYVETTHKQLALHKEMKLVKEGKTTMSASPAHTMLSDLLLTDHPNLPPLRTYQAFAIHKDRAYVVTLTYPKSTSEAAVKQYTNLFNKFLASFRWEQEAAPKK